VSKLTQIGETNTYLAEPGEHGEFTLGAGGSIYLDNQQETLAMSFVSNDGGMLLVATVPLAATPEATPSP
jgi:hypothetical protein